MARWSPLEAGVLELPGGRTVRGRGSRRPADDAVPDLTVQLSFFRPHRDAQRTTWIAWPDFGLPIDHRAAERVLLEAWRRSDRERVDVTCRGGRGRTGTALALLAVIDGMHPAAAIELVRRRYDRRAVETPWQERYVLTRGPAAPSR